MIRMEMNPDGGLRTSVECPWCSSHMHEGIVAATCAGGSHKEIDGYYCKMCDFSIGHDRQIYSESMLDYSQRQPTFTDLVHTLLGG